jgi:hypothetical protein
MRTDYLVGYWMTGAEEQGGEGGERGGGKTKEMLYHLDNPVTPSGNQLGSYPDAHVQSRAYSPRPACWRISGRV